MVSTRAVVLTDGTEIDADDGPIRIGAKVRVESFVQPILEARQSVSRLVSPRQSFRRPFPEEILVFVGESA